MSVYLTPEHGPFSTRDYRKYYTPCQSHFTVSQCVCSLILEISKYLSYNEKKKKKRI